MVINELRLNYKLKDLLKCGKISKSTFYYTLNIFNKSDKNKSIKDKIFEIFEKSHKTYGYRRITIELQNQGYIINHKKVLRIMNELNIRPIKLKKRRYISYKGTVGKIADNIIKRQFKAEKPNKKWYTDITEFNLRGEKIYLSPILDGYNNEIISYNISKSPNMLQIKDMLEKAFKGKDLNGLIMHSDQGWQYQNPRYQQSLKEHGIIQSMSRKGNCMDNGMMENFFGILKTEMFYEQENRYANTEELINGIKDYIFFYNHDRIKSNLKGLSPIQYRLQSF